METIETVKLKFEEARKRLVIWNASKSSTEVEGRWLRNIIEALDTAICKFDEGYIRSKMKFYEDVWDESRNIDAENYYMTYGWILGEYDDPLSAFARLPATTVPSVDHGNGYCVVIDSKKMDKVKK